MPAALSVSVSWRILSRPCQGCLEPRTATAAAAGAALLKRIDNDREDDDDDEDDEDDAGLLLVVWLSRRLLGLACLACSLAVPIWIQQALLLLCPGWPCLYRPFFDQETLS